MLYLVQQVLLSSAGRVAGYLEMAQEQSIYDWSLGPNHLDNEPIIWFSNGTTFWIPTFKKSGFWMFQVFEGSAFRSPL